ncbi:MAG: S41 family peptidase [Bacteroidota bacterium]
MKNSVYHFLHVVLVLMFGLIWSNQLSAQKKYSLQQAQADFDFLIAELQAKHQGLYLHLSKAETDRRLDSLRAQLFEDIDRVRLFKIMNAVIALTNEGHTGVKLPKASLLKLGTSQSFLPIIPRFLEGKAYLLQYFGKEEKDLQRGVKILSINGRSMETILAEAYPYIPTDGLNQTSAREWLGWRFPFIYRIGFGASTRFDMVVERDGGQKDTVKLNAVRATRIKGKHGQLRGTFLKHKDLQYEQINDSIAYLAVNSFSIPAKEYVPWLQMQFQKINQAGIKHLILDVQDNGGGSEGKENLLMCYLTNDVFQKYKFVSMPTAIYQPIQNRKGIRFDQWSDAEKDARRGTFSLQSDYFSEFDFQKPDSNLVFQGKLYLLTSGISFSGGAEFSSMIKMTGRGLVVGEETGGVYEGNVSGYSRSVRLPHSRIEVSVPIVYFRINVEPAVLSRGVMPDHEVPQTATDYFQGKNSKKKYVLENILGISPTD